MRVLKYIWSILKDFGLSLFHVILGLCMVGLILGLETLILILGLLAISIIPNLLSHLGYNGLANILLIIEIIIVFLFIIDVNIFKLPRKISSYLKNKWEELE